LILDWCVFKNISYDNSIIFLLWTDPFGFLSFKRYCHSIVQHQSTMISSWLDVGIFVNRNYQLDFICRDIGLKVNNSFEDLFFLSTKVSPILGILKCLKPVIINSISLFHYHLFFLLLVCSKKISRSIQVLLF